MKKRVCYLAAMMIVSACGTPSTPGAANNVAGTAVFDNQSSAQQGIDRRNAAPVKLKFKAAVIKGSGDQVAVAREDLLANPYSLEKIKSELVLKNKPGDKPVPPTAPSSPLLTDYLTGTGGPSSSDPKYKKRECLSYGCYDTTDYDAYDRDRDAWRQSQEDGYNMAVNKFNDARVAYQAAVKKFEEDTKAWEAKAYAGQQEAVKQASGGLMPVAFKTNLSGEADITLTEGIWYFTGKYSLLQGESNIFWTEVPITISKTTTEVELSNDNGKVLNTSSGQLEPSSPRLSPVPGPLPTLPPSSTRNLTPVSTSTPIPTPTPTPLAKVKSIGTAFKSTLAYVNRGVEIFQVSVELEDGTFGFINNLKSVSFVSADPSIASVNDEGIISGNKVGKTTITLTYQGVSTTIEVEVVKES